MKKNEEPWNMKPDIVITLKDIYIFVRWWTGLWWNVFKHMVNKE